MLEIVVLLLRLIHDGIVHVGALNGKPTEEIRIHVVELGIVHLSGRRRFFPALTVGLFRGTGLRGIRRGGGR